MKNIAIASLFAALVVATAPAIAGEHDHHAPAKSNDAEKANDAEFAKLDTDKDGFISKSELPAKHPAMPSLSRALPLVDAPASGVRTIRD